MPSPGHSTVGPDKFISLLREMQLDFNLCDYELRRVFDGLDANCDGQLSLEEFKVGRKSHPFSAALVDLLNRSSSTSLASNCFPDPEYILDASTAEFYSRPLDNGFVGRNGSIRKLLDYQYHNNYMNEFQLR